MVPRRTALLSSGSSGGSPRSVPWRGSGHRGDPRGFSIRGGDSSVSCKQNGVTGVVHSSEEGPLAQEAHLAGGCCSES